MEEILRTLNRKGVADNQKVLVFTDNAPIHSQSYIDFFSHVKIAFLPKHKTSTLQPLDTRIIKTF